MNLPQMKARLGRWLADQLPTMRRTIYNVRSMPRLEAGDLDVDRVHEIIEAAKNGNVQDLWALYLELICTGSHLQGRLVDRKEAVLSDTLNIQPIDKENRDDVAAAAVIADMVEHCQHWEKALAHLLDSVIYPVSLLEKTFKPSAPARMVAVPDGSPVKLSYELDCLTVVPYDLLDYRNGKLQLRETDELGNTKPDLFDPLEPRYIIYRGHLLGAPDNFGGPMRSIVFWTLLGSMGRDWWARYMERYASPFIVGKYNDGDEGARSVLMGAFSAATKLWGLVVSRETEVELQQAAASSSGDAYDQWKTVCNEEISKLINGQTLGSDAKATGMGSGVAKNQNEVRSDKRKSDARRLGHCLRHSLFAQYLEINGLKGRPPKCVWASDTPDEAKATGESLSALSQAGLEPADEALPVISEKMGFPVQRAPLEVALPGGVKSFSAGRRPLRRREMAEQANEAIVRGAAADLAPQLRKDYAPIVQLIARSSSPEDAIARVEAYCAALDPLEAADITERALAAMAANGCVVSAR